MFLALSQSNRRAVDAALEDLIAVPDQYRQEPDGELESMALFEDLAEKATVLRPRLAATATETPIEVSDEDLKLIALALEHAITLGKDIAAQLPDLDRPDDIKEAAYSDLFRLQEQAAETLDLIRQQAEIADVGLPLDPDGPFANYLEDQSTSPGDDRALKAAPDNADGDPVQYLLDGLGDPDRGVGRPLTASAVAQIVMGYIGQDHPGEIASDATLLGVSFDVLVDPEHGPFLLASTLTADHRGHHRQATAIVMLRVWDVSSVPEREFPLAVAENLVGVRPVTEATFPTYGPSLEDR